MKSFLCVWSGHRNFRFVHVAPECVYRYRLCLRCGEILEAVREEHTIKGITGNTVVIDESVKEIKGE